jgi:hypothetical protein
MAMRLLDRALVSFGKPKLHSDSLLMFLLTNY